MLKREKEFFQYMLDNEEQVIKALEKHYKDALSDINMSIRIMQSDKLTQSKVYQLQYQQALKKQVEGILERLHAKEYTTIQQYLSDSYTNGFVGSMYSMHGQGIPMIATIDQNAAVKAVITDSQIREGLYNHLAVGVDGMKKAIREELTRGIASNMDYDDIARNIAFSTRASLANTKNIVRTEGHRIQQASADDARHYAASRGADMLKQWDATLDGNTRKSHRELDGTLVELDEFFVIGTKKARYPGDFGDPALDCQCRCVALDRPRWALDEAELETLKERAAFFKLDKSDSFEDFKKKYLKAAETIEEVDDEFDIFSYLENNEIVSDIDDVPSIQYPDDLLLTKKEQDMLEGLNAYYENPELPISKQPKNYRIPTDAERMAMNGKLTDEFVSIERQRLQMKLANAEEMIQQRRNEGYKFDKTAAIARREMNRELAREEGHLVVGQDGIRYWQSNRKRAITALEDLEFAEKLQRRYVFTNAANIQEEAMARAAKIEANGLFVNKEESLYRFAKKIQPIDGFEDFTCHADANSFYIDLGGKGKEEDFFTLTPEEYADRIRKSSTYKGGNIRIISCQAGAKDDGAAQRLANALGVEVFAPTEIVNITENGEMFVSDNDILAEMWYNTSDRTSIKQTGEWKIFKPRKE